VIDPREISAMAGQIMAPAQPAFPGQPAPAGQPMTAPAPRPEDLMALLGGGGPPMPGPEQGGTGGGPPTKPAPDLVPPGLKEEIAKYAAHQQVQMSRQLLALAGPESSDVPAGRTLLKELWSKRKEGVSDEQIQAWRAEGKQPAWILANSYPGRYALMAMGHWKPSEKAKFARQMRRLLEGDGGASAPGQTYDPASLETVADEDPTPAIEL
jgi:hypothetical protein